MGYLGWGSKYPSLSTFAKKVLLEKGPMAFENTFGAYFVVGQNMGAFTQIELTQECEDEHEKTSMGMKM